MKAINVNNDACIGCGACVAIDDEHFNFDGEGKSNVISNENLESANLTNAIESCPVGAISLIEGEDKKCDCNENCVCECKDNEDCSCEDECNCEGCHGCHIETASEN